VLFQCIKSHFSVAAKFQFVQHCPSLTSPAVAK
jgi:hypothetical protein